MKGMLAAASTTLGLVLSVPQLVSAQTTGNDKAQLDPVASGRKAHCVDLHPVPAAVLDAPFLVFGEVHGTREVPDFVVAYLCAATKKQRRITLAVEYPTDQQNALDAFLASDGKPEDVERLIATAMWRNERQDGRTSVDMLRMYESIRTLRAGGADIKVVAIDGQAAPALRDAVMADNLRTELQQGQGRQVLALIGGLHAVRNKGNRFNPQYESAIYRLADKNPLALTVGTAGGAAWVCRGGTPASCHPTTWDINRIAPAPTTPFSLTPPSPQFDGVFFVGETTASPPAVKRTVPGALSGGQ